MQLVGSYTNCVSGYLDNSSVCQRISGALYHNITAGFSFGSKIDLRLGILNFTNRDPPFVSGGQDSTDPATYPLLGRTFFVDLRTSFR